MSRDILSKESILGTLEIYLFARILVLSCKE